MNLQTYFLQSLPDVCFSKGFPFLLEFSQCIHNTGKLQRLLVKGLENCRMAGNMNLQ